MIDHIETECYFCDKELYSTEEIFKTIFEMAEGYVYDFCSNECFQATVKAEPEEIYCGFKTLLELKQYIDNIPVRIYEAKKEYKHLKEHIKTLTDKSEIKCFKDNMEKLKSIVVVETQSVKEYSSYLTNVCCHDKLINTVDIPGGFISGNCEVCNMEITKINQLSLF